MTAPEGPMKDYVRTSLRMLYERNRAFINDMNPEVIEPLHAQHGNGTRERHKHRRRHVRRLPHGHYRRGGLYYHLVVR